MTPRFENQVAVITGAATGLGEGIALRLATEGASVALLDRDGARLDVAVTTFQNLGFCAQGYLLDVAEEPSVQEAMKAVEKNLGAHAALTTRL